ncbi:MAG: phosphofructokinase [Chloroflexi bacterium]|nr:MAG: phosphofructokinase [Chloroflexota bacterium]
MLRIGVLTGGGDVPGLNPCIKQIVYRAEDAGHEIYGIRRGWAGLLEYDLDEKDDKKLEHWVWRLDKQRVRTVDRTGGTFLHTSRTNPSHVQPQNVPENLQGMEVPRHKDKRDRDVLDYTEHVLRVLDRLGLDILIPIGGDDTLSYGERLHREGFKVVAIPKTMDNDVYGTDYCIGFSTAVTRSVEFIHNLRTSAGSHERIAVVELFGRNSGETSLIAAYLAGVDRAIISEVPFNAHNLANLLVADKQTNPSNYAMLTISEGARLEEGEIVQTGEADAYGHQKLGGIGQVTGDLLKDLTGQNIIYQQVAYLMRSGAPDSLDLMVAANYAQMAMSLVEQGRFGRMVALQRGLYTDINMSTISQGVKRVNVAELYDVEQYRPKVRHVFGMPMFLM